MGSNRLYLENKHLGETDLARRIAATGSCDWRLPSHSLSVYPDLEYDGKDRTDALTEKMFNRTVFADGAKSVVFFNDIEADDEEHDQFECFLQLSAQVSHFHQQSIGGSLLESQRDISS